MAWNTEETKRRLRASALSEFAEHGPDGTTMTRIADRAGINKERLYAYFGDKEALFDEILTEALNELSRAVAPDGLRYEDPGEFAGRAFDYHLAHPELVRLLQWEALRGGPPVNSAARTDHYRQKVNVARQAQQNGLLDNRIDPGHLVFMIIAIATSWTNVPQLAEMLTGSSADDPKEQTKRRAAVVLAAQRLAPTPPDAPAKKRAVQPGRSG